MLNSYRLILSACIVTQLLLSEGLGEQEEITHLSERVPVNLRSTDNRQRVSVTWVNRTGKNLQIFWIDQNGNLRLGHQNQFHQGKLNTYVGHQFLFFADGQLIGHWSPKTPGAKVVSIRLPIEGNHQEKLLGSGANHSQINPESNTNHSNLFRVPLIVGVWRTINAQGRRGLWIVRPDGTAYNDHFARGNGEGTWKAASENGYDFDFRWNGGIDHVKINKDGKTFEGFHPGNNARWRMVRAAYPSHQFIIPEKNSHTESHKEKRSEKPKTVIPKSSRPKPKPEEPIKKLSPQHAKRILNDADLWEGKPGVWFLNQANNFANRVYERLSKSSEIRSALRVVNGRLPTPAEMNNPPSRR